MHGVFMAPRCVVSCESDGMVPCTSGIDFMGGDYPRKCAA